MAQSIRVVDSVSNRPPCTLDRNGMTTVGQVLSAAGVSVSGNHAIFVNGEKRSTSDPLPAPSETTMQIVVSPGAPKNA